MYRIMNYKNIDFNLLEKVNNFSLFIHLDENKYSLYTNSIELNEVFELEKENLPQLPSYSKILKRKKHTISNLKEKLKKFTNKESLKVHREDVLSNIKVDEIDFYKPLNMKKFSLIDLIDELDNIWMEIKINKIKYDIENELEMLADMHNILDLLVNNKIEYLLKNHIPNDIIKQVFTTKIENIFFTKAYENIKKLMELFNKEKPFFTKIKIYGEKEEVDEAIKKIEKYFIDEAVEFAEENSIKSRFELFFTYDEVKNFCYLPLGTKTLKKDLDIGDKYALFLDEEKQCFINKENKSGEEIDFDLKYIHNLQIKYDSSKKEEFKDLLQRILLYNVKKRLEEGNDIKIYHINFDYEEYLSNISFLISENILFQINNYNDFSEYLENIMNLIKVRKSILKNTKKKDIFSYNENETMINLKEDILILVINANSINNKTKQDIIRNLIQYSKLGIFVILYNAKKFNLNIPFLELNNSIKFYNIKAYKINLPLNIKILIKQIVKLLNNNQQQNEKNFIEIPIGVDEYRNTVYFKLGDKTQSYHGIIVGKTGTGKTSLIKNILLETAKKYTANEIKFILMDYKPGGVEFNLFDKHPSVEIINTSPNDFSKAQKVFEAIKNIIKKREQLFNKYKISNISEYNLKFPNSKLPHYIVIIDEFQRLINENFSGKLSGYFNSFLSDFVRNYRAFGFHLLLSTQTLKKVDLASDVLELLSTRISFRVLDYFSVEKIIDSKLPLSLNKYECLYNVKGAEEIFIKVYTYPPLSYEEMNKIFEELKSTKKNEYLEKPPIIV